MNVQAAISAFRRHTPLPAEGTYDATVFAEISQALSVLPECPPNDAIPILLACADRHSDERLLSGAAHVLAGFPLDVLQQYLADLPSQNLPTVWLLAIFYQLPQFASREHLERLREGERDDECIERIDSELKNLRGDETPESMDVTLSQFKRRQKLIRICEQADQAFREKAYGRVVQILASYQDILPPTHQQKLQIARRKST